MITALLLLLLLQDEIVSETIHTQAYGDQFERAMALFNSVDREQSRPLFLELIQSIEQKGTKNPEDREIYALCLQWLGVLGYPAETDPYFERLVRFDPDYSMVGQKISPKIINHFNALKSRLVGTVRFAISEADGTGLVDKAAVWVDGQSAGVILAGKTTLAMWAGSHRVEVTKPNFETFSTTIAVKAGEEIKVPGMLHRKSAELQFVTVPSDVAVYFQNELKGRSTGASPASYAERLVRLGISPAQASEVFSIDEIPPGEYVVRFEKPCYKPKSFKIQLTKVERKSFEPIVLDPAAAYLDVSTAQPSSGIVYLDQERIGSLPISAHQVCPGSKTLRVQFTDGVFQRDLLLEEGKTTQVVAEPLPSLVWFGIQEKEGEKPGEDVEFWLRSLRTWNFRRINPNDTRQVPHDPFDLFFSQGGFNSAAAEVLNRGVNADLYVAARVVRRKVVIRYLEVAFWSPLSPRTRLYAFDFRELDQLKALLQNLDGEMPLTRAWLGLQVVKVEGEEGCRVVAVDPAGPAAKLIQEGALLKSCNGVLLDSPTPLTRLVAGREAILETGGSYIKITPVSTMAELPYHPSSFCPPAMIARLEKTSRYSGNSLVRESARFNQARFQFFVGDFQQAFDTFSTFKLSHNSGIGQGTLHFYQALCFRKLNLQAEASASFKEAQRFPGATLFDADGPKVAFWAQIQE